MSLYFKIKDAFERKGLTDMQAYFAQFRLEARARNADNDDSLAMRTADPLWMLGRQWQLGEFVGEDNGSPISAFANYYKRKTQYYSTNGVMAKMDEGPLEATVEAMAITSDDFDLRMQVKIGEQFKRILRRRFGNDAGRYIDLLQEKYPLALKQPPKSDAASKRLIRLMKGKAINGSVLLKGGLSPDFANLKDAVRELAAWFEALYRQPPSKDAKNQPVQIHDAWMPEYLWHRFSVHAPDELDGDTKVTLKAPDYQSGHLDWYSFDKAEGGKELKGENTNMLIPANLSFAAMPHKRLYSFEDNFVDLGSMDIQDDDLIRMMLLDFSLYSGSDWYTIPLEIGLGELSWINYIRVKDVFGVTTEIKNGPQNGRDVGPAFSKDQDGDKKLTDLDVWDVFKIRDRPITTYNALEHFLYIAPAATGSQESEPLEQILFFRDEFANMAWAKEEKVQNRLGKPVDGYDLHLEVNGPFLPLSEADKKTEDQNPKYRLASTVPFNWIPYLPAPGERGSLRRAFMVSNEPDKPLRDIEPISYLASKELLNIREEAIPKAGVRVQITKQRIRWTNGKTYIWQGRKVLAGRGEGDSGLRFDYLKYP